MTIGSDEQRPAPPDEDLQHVITIYEMTLQAVIGDTDDPDLKEYFERTLANTARFLVESAAERAVPPAMESLPVGTDSARAEAEERYGHDASSKRMSAFIAGAEWARAEERKARGE